MRQIRRSPTSSTSILAALLATFALLAGIYYSLRFGGWSIEGDASSLTTAAVGMLESGRLEYPGTYNNGFGYPSQLAIISMVTGLPVQTIQIGSSLWVFALALLAYITYRELLGSNAVAGLATLVLFIQPDFLFYVVRGSHEKNTWAYALLMVFLLVRSYHHIHQPKKLLLYIGLFYLVFWALTASNVYFATTFIGAISLSFVGGWVLSRLRKKENPRGETKAASMQRLIIISLACFTLAYVFIHYTYKPALQIYYLFTNMSDRISLMLLGSQQAATPVSYQYFAQTWRSQWAYLGLTGLQWLIALTSLLAWGLGLVKLARLEQRPWLLWLMYSAFGVLMVFGVVADYAGFMSANLQLRMFTPFALFSSPMAASLIAWGFHKVKVRWRRVAAVGLTAIITIGAAAVMLKVTNDPTFGNQWFFYSPAELAPLNWLDQSKVPHQQVWVDTWHQLDSAFDFWEGHRPAVQYQFITGGRQPSVPYILITELARLRTNHSGINLPDTNGQNRIYDDGTAQVYHRRPVTPYQH